MTQYPLPVALILALAVTAGAAIGSQKQPGKSKIPDKATIDFGTDRPFGNVRVPYHLVNGTPAIAVTWNGHKTDCFLDTGTTRLTTFSPMGLGGDDWGDGGNYTWAGGRSYKCRIVSTDIRIGSIRIKDFPQYLVGDKKLTAAQMPSALPIIGSDLMSYLVVSFDPVKKEVAFRTPTYQPDVKGAHVLPVHWDGYDQPYVDATINGKRVKMTVDTGWNGSYVVNVKAAKRLFPRVKVGKATTKAGIAAGAWAQVKSVLKLGPETDVTHSVNVCDMMTLTDGSVGWPFLTLYDITLDFPRHRLILRNLSPADVKRLANESQ